MNDINGVKLEAGQIVRISNAFHKSDNGLYLIVSDPESPTGGEYYTLHRISARGKLSCARRTLNYWPLIACSANYLTRMDIKLYNEEHAQIEVTTVENLSDAIAYFRKEACFMEAVYEDLCERYGSEYEKQQARECSVFYAYVAEKLEFQQPV